MDQHLPIMVNPEGPELEDMHPRPQQCKSGPQVISCLGDTLEDTQGKDSCVPSPIQELDRESTSEMAADVARDPPAQGLSKETSEHAADVARDPPAETQSMETSENGDDQSLSSSGTTQPSLISEASALISCDSIMRPDSCGSAVMGSTDTAGEGMGAPTTHGSDLPLQHVGMDSSVEMDSTVFPLQQTSMAAALGSSAHSEAGPCPKVLQALEHHGISLDEQLHQHLEFLGLTSRLQAQQTTLHQEELPSTQQQGWLQRLRDWIRRSRKWVRSLRKCCWRRRRNTREQEPCPVTLEKKVCGSEGCMGDGVWHTRACNRWRLQQFHQVLQDMDSQVQERRAWVRREMDAITREAPVN
ncbi:uncharacterized protein LOC134446672 [Engraulis encrasicolus]|uniref:uncharacterized protein LOC134446672 n=1 Tax=Engraulis encrasicolus TaxID=184585 RepID=UPI002FD4CF44